MSNANPEAYDYAYDILLQHLEGVDLEYLSVVEHLDCEGVFTDELGEAVFKEATRQLKAIATAYTEGALDEAIRIYGEES